MMHLFVAGHFPIARKSTQQRINPQGNFVEVAMSKWQREKNQS
jgi:hypothetical protein